MVFFIAFFTLLHLPVFAKPILFSDTTKTIAPFINSCSVNTIPHLRDPLRFYSLCFSDHVLGNMYWIPTCTMIALLIITFFLIKKFTRSITYSLFGVLLVILTNSFGNYAFSATYDQTWVALLFLSIYILNTKYKHLVVIPFIFSLGFRGLPLLDIPIIITQIIILDIQRKQKILLLIPVCCVTIVATLYTFEGGIAISQNQQFIFDLGKGLTSIQSFRMDVLFFMSMIPLAYLLHRIKTRESAFIFFTITYLIFQVFYLSAFTNLTQQPYRMFPLIIFIALGYSYALRRLLSKVEMYETH